MTEGLARGVTGWRVRYWPAWLRGRWGMTAGLTGVYVLGYLAWVSLAQGDEQLRSAASNFALLPIDLIAAGAALSPALDRALPASLRRAWRFISLALFANFLGDLLYFALANGLGVPEGQLALSLADPAYLAFYPLLLVGVLSLPVAPVAGAARLKLWLDLGTGLVAAWMAVWFFIIAPAAQPAGPGWLSQAIAAAYPIGDLVLLAGFLSLIFRRPDAATRAALLFLLAAILCFIASDLTYAALVVAGTFVSGGWADLGWFVASFFFFVAAARQRHYSAEVPPLRPWEAALERLAPALPLLAILFGYGVLLGVQMAGTTERMGLGGVYAGASLLTVLVAGRQAVDLVENRRLNAELRGLSAELEARVIARTQELNQAQEELMAAQKLAIVGTLAAEVVHEISNPLNNIVSASESLEGDLQERGRVEAETLAVYLPIMSRSAWHASRILQSLRSFSRGQTPELAPQNLAGVVQDTLILLAPRLKKSGQLRLAVDVPDDLPRVVCDRNQIAQVLINLINNAQDAMPAGGRISLRARAVAGGVALEVQDEGLGLTEAEQARLFTAFYTTKPIGQGSGLGLSIVERIVRAHRGSVRVFSQGPGHGSTFTIVLPAEAG